MTLDWAVSSAGLILIVGLLRFVLKDRLRAGVRYAVWGLVLLRLLLPVNLGQSAVSLLNAVERTPAARTAELVETVDRVERGENGTVEGYRTRPDGGAELVFTRPATDREYQQMERALTWQTLLPLVWLAGAAVVLAALGASSLRFYARLRRSRRRLAVRCRVPVYVSGAVEAPCLAGLLRPAIYLTEAAAADPAVIRHVLAHELTHLRHRDNLWAALRGICLALHWFDPLVRGTGLRRSGAAPSGPGGTGGLRPHPAGHELRPRALAAGDRLHPDRRQTQPAGAGKPHRPPAPGRGLGTGGPAADGGAGGRVYLYRRGGIRHSRGGRFFRGAKRRVRTGEHTARGEHLRADRYPRAAVLQPDL